MGNKTEIAVVVGQRLRARRNQLGYSQDTVSEKADLHPTYIGQLERGEKNATLCSIEKVCRALEMPMDELFTNIVDADSTQKQAQRCYDLVMSQPLRDQKKLCSLIEDIIRYKES